MSAKPAPNLPMYKQLTFFDVMPEVAVPTVKVVDIGANPTGYTPIYKSMLDKRKAMVTGFEADRGAYDELVANQGPFESYLNYIVGDGSDCTFYNCVHPWMSSIYEPYQEMLDHFFWCDDNGKVVSTEAGTTTRIDDIAELPEFDLFRLDIQGAELKACQGAEKKLKDSCLIIQAETLFIPLYKGQPLFSELELYLRSLGFSFLKFHDIQERSIKPMAPNGDWEKGYALMMFADSVFIKDFLRWDELNPSQLAKMAAMLHTCYHAYDFAHLALRHLDKQLGSNTAQAYHQKLRVMQVPM